MIKAEEAIFYDGPPQEAVSVRVPATMGNVGAGFDVLGLALDWWTYLHVRRTGEGLRITNTGEGAGMLPTDTSHLVYRAAASLFEHSQQPVPGLEIEVDNRLPLARGLGSSAAAVVAGLAAAAVLAGGTWRRADLFRLAVPLEGHPDNVAPAVYGSLTICPTPEPDGGVGGEGTPGDLPLPVVLPPLANVRLVVVVPDFELSTRQARMVLPETVAHADAVTNVAASALTVAAFATGRAELLRHGLKDRLHQPYRARLIPGFDHVVSAARQAGALGAVLSGAGPTITAFFSTDEGREAHDRIEAAGQDMLAAFNAAGCGAKAHIQRISDHGVSLAH